MSKKKPTKKKYGLLAVLLTLALPSLATAQVNIRVLGVGKVAFDVALPQTEAQLQVYKLYVPATATAPTITPTVTCVAAGATATCTFPLSVFTIPAPPATLGFAITATVAAVDGEQESAKVTAPFVLSRAAPAAAPAFSATPIRPATP